MTRAYYCRDCGTFYTNLTKCKCEEQIKTRDGVTPNKIAMETMQQTELFNRAGTIEAALAYLGDEDEEAMRYKKLITVFDDPTDHLVNYQAAVVLVRAVNEKREPKWDGKEIVYANWFYMKGGSSVFAYRDFVFWNSFSLVGSRLYFFDPTNGEWLAKRHPDVFKNFMLIKK